MLFDEKKMFWYILAMPNLSIFNYSLTKMTSGNENSSTVVDNTSSSLTVKINTISVVYILATLIHSTILIWHVQILYQVKYQIFFL